MSSNNGKHKVKKYFNFQTSFSQIANEYLVCAMCKSRLVISQVLLQTEANKTYFRACPLKEQQL